MFETLDHARVAEIHCKSDPHTHLHAIIAIHNTRLGAALGGCRFIPYRNDEAALQDAVRLARGMSYKAALAGVPQGGGKAVIMRPPGNFDRALLFKTFGEFVEDLGGRYITAIDSGTTLADMDCVASKTHHVTGSLRDGLDPSPMTALGVFEGIKAAVKFRLGQLHLRGIVVAIQGLGNVGWALAELLHEAGAKLILSDIDESKLLSAKDRFKAKIVAHDQIIAERCDIFAPCALGSVINDKSILQLKCQIIAGSANNQLDRPEHGDELHRMSIL
ncbi:MAG TPA: Glu/Leu/Phe/Val dehydrogenase dimerization domain-containing protein, partial [Pseudomonadales bacterium]|nr:Glu/Leu/Phe/Val dehydrogenase dimerization domain-containing protein [Pseudomonadales bacterium]